ncbi:hypothetical protein Clacol_008798 [Clathrus columnatus]|uniref:Uncharacterized protein n=1 Tax=Clathrus columnatus TaxID=1419009 RepID=A0AAV5APC8_9AGAM|nr:hypothetical protein Clacol_008798 [Clathrus columnatus]
MILSKLANLPSSSLTLGHSSSEVTTDVAVDPLKKFFNKLRLKELVYDSDLSFRDGFPLTYRPPPEGSQARPLLYVMKLGCLHDEVTYFFTKSATIKEKEQDILKLKLSLNYDSAAMTKAFGFNPYHIHNIQDVIYALERGPIRSAERLAKSINDTITDYHFMTSRDIYGHRINGIDPLLFTYLAYPNERLPNEKSLVRCMLIPFAPWEFTSNDFIRFTSMGVFMDGPGHVDATWSYILDTCVQTNCEYFILTTHAQTEIVFCRQAFREAFISEPISNKADVLKYLTYWILTSCSTPDTTDMDSVILKHRLEYELVVKKKHLDSGKRGKYKFQLISSQRVPDIVIKDFPIEGVYDYHLPEPVKEWNRWCKEDSDKKKGSSNEEVGEGVNEESVDDETVEEASGVITAGDVTGETGKDMNIEDDDASEHEVVLRLIDVETETIQHLRNPP